VWGPEFKPQYHKITKNKSQEMPAQGVSLWWHRWSWELRVQPSVNRLKSRGLWDWSWRGHLGRWRGEWNYQVSSMGVGRHGRKTMAPMAWVSRRGIRRLKSQTFPEHGTKLPLQNPARQTAEWSRQVSPEGDLGRFSLDRIIKSERKYD
jgi:hypothetical protein